MYAVEFLPSAAKALEKLDISVRRRIASRIDRFASDPRAEAIKLRATDAIWRARVGDYRILYEIFDDRVLVLVIKIGHRRDVYR